MAYEEKKTYNHLEELKGSDYQIIEDEPNINGWDVIDGEGRKIGEVDDVLFDPQTRDVRYIIVDLEENELEVDTDKKVLVPIGIAELREEEEGAIEKADSEIDPDQDSDVYDHDLVYLPTVTAAHLLALPVYEKGSLSPEKEVAIRNVFERSETGAVVVYDPTSFYTHEQFNNKIYPERESKFPGRFDESSPGNDGGNSPGGPAL